METGRLLSEELGDYTEVARHGPLVLFTNRTNLAGDSPHDDGSEASGI